MTYRYIPNLNWDTRNMAYTLLYNEFKHIRNKKLGGKLAQTNKKSGITDKGLKLGQNKKKLFKRIKNNQFNIKWSFNRYLKFYYQALKSSHLSSIETRLDVLLFRTNWFINKEAVRSAIKKGLATWNGELVKGYNGFVKPGDIIKIKATLAHGSNYSVNAVNNPSINKGWLNTHYNYISSTSRLNRLSSLKNWLYQYKYNIIPNMPYLEINNNFLMLMVLNIPKYTDIPYPFNLRKFR